MLMSSARSAYLANGCYLSRPTKNLEAASLPDRSAQLRAASGSTLCAITKGLWSRPQLPPNGGQRKTLDGGWLDAHVHLQMPSGQRLLDVDGLQKTLQGICQWRVDSVFIRRQ